MKETKTCKYCKKEIDKEVKICPHCLKVQSIPTVKGICLFLLAIAIIGGIFSTLNNNTNTISNDNSSMVKEEKNNSNNIQENELKANSNEKLNYLIKKGQSKAKDASIEEINEAINYIKSNIDNPFSNNDIMENLIYYGSILEYYYAKDGSSFNGFTNIKGNIGMNTIIAIKYVYRNIETPTDDSTIHNINKVKKDLTSIN